MPNPAIPIENPTEKQILFYSVCTTGYIDMDKDSDMFKIITSLLRTMPSDLDMSFTGKRTSGWESIMAFPLYSNNRAWIQAFFTIEPVRRNGEAAILNKAGELGYLDLLVDLQPQLKNHSTTADSFIHLVARYCSIDYLLKTLAQNPFHLIRKTKNGRSCAHVLAWYHPDRLIALYANYPQLLLDDTPQTDNLAWEADFRKIMHAEFRSLQAQLVIEFLDGVVKYGSEKCIRGLKILIERKVQGAEEALNQLTGVANKTRQITDQSSSTSTSSAPIVTAPVSHELQLENAQLKKIIEDQAMALNSMSKINLELLSENQRLKKRELDKDEEPDAKRARQTQQTSAIDKTDAYQAETPLFFKK